MQFDRRIAQADSEEEVFSIIAAVANDLGFPYCLFRIRMPLPISKKPAVQYDNFVLSDPSVAPARARDDSRGCRYIVLPEGTIPPQERMNLGRIRTDWVKSIFSPNGTSALLAVGSNPGSQLVPISASDHLTLDLLFESAHQRLSQFLLSRLIPESTAKLSSRELEVVRWICEGKTSFEMALIIGISVPTVNFHIKNIIEKMRCANRTHAAVKALALGFLN
jgi:LuxR family transcriptional regulator, quorum-sensing system regulator SolR